MFWPGIALGAFLDSAYGNYTLWTNFLTALANTGGVCFGFWLLSRVARFENKMERVRDVVAFIFFGALGPSLFSGLICTPILLLNDATNPSQHFRGVFMWTMGDIMGVLLVTPVLLSLGQPRKSALYRGRVMELIGLSGLLLIVTAFIFASQAPLGMHHYPGTFVPFPFLIWAALRFGQREDKRRNAGCVQYRHRRHTARQWSLPAVPSI